MSGMDTPDLEVSGDAVAVVDIEGQSNEEVEALTSRISNETESLRAQTVTLDALVAAVDDSVAAKKEADEEARIAAEKERLEAEIAQKKSAAQPIGYEDLFRAGDTLIGQYFRFEGKIIQTLGASGTTSGYRINITADQGYSRVFWEDTVMLMVSGETPQKLLEDDIVGSSVSCLLAGLGLAGRMGVICSVGVAHGSSDLAAVLGVSFL